jgi:hypothetical protein
MDTIHPKVAAAGVAGAISIVIVWVANLFGIDVPAEVAAAFTTILATAAGFIKSA